MTTIKSLIEEYRNSIDWKELRPSTKKIYEYALEHWRNDSRPVSSVTRHEILTRMNAIHAPSMGRIFGVVTNKLLNFAVDRGIVDTNVAAGIRKPRTNGSHKKWPGEAIIEFIYECNDVNYVLMSFALNTGMRMSDIVSLNYTRDMRFESSNMVVIEKRQTKTSEIVYTKVDVGMAYLHYFLIQSKVSKFGYDKALKLLSNGFRNQARKYGYTFHGLRKNFAAALAESGASAEEIAAALGHRSTVMASYYAKEANKKVLVENAMKKLWKN